MKRKYFDTCVLALIGMFVTIAIVLTNQAYYQGEADVRIEAFKQGYEQVWEPNSRRLIWQPQAHPVMLPRPIPRDW